ncbi:MAG: TolC family protein [Candidatus Eremiobacteraeota bacterium]|nr:TolC family protein [Candidatus Eremiobacteraeota bacterium]
MRGSRTRALSAAVALAALAAGALPVRPTSAQADGGLPARASLPTPIPSPSLPPVPSVAPGYHAAAAPPGSPAIVGVTQQPFVGISLQDAVAMALLQNPNLAISASNARIARYRIAEAKSAFDTQLMLEPSSSFSVTPPENLFFAGPGNPGLYTCQPIVGPPFPCETAGPGNIIQHQYNFQGSFSGQLVNGTSYSIGIVRTRTYNNTLINTFNPYYQSSLNLAVTQPLLRNFGMNAGKRALNLQLLTTDSQEQQALVDASSTVAQVEDSYWNLVAAWRNVAIQEEALKDAATQEQSVARIARRGAVAPVAAVEAQSQVAKFQSDVFAALETVSRLQNQLKSLIVSDPDDPIWRANLVPSSPVQQLPAVQGLSTVVRLAASYRPEVRQAQDQIRQADVDRAYAKNQLLPQADLQVQYQSNGFAGLLAPVPGFESTGCNLPTGGCPTPPPETQGKMGTATANMWAWRYPAFNVSFNVNIPLENSFARGLKQTAEQEEQQAAIEAQGVDQRIGSEARDALQSYQSALSRLYAASQSRQSAEAVYASEVRKFHAGTSTTFLVLQRQVQLAAARGRELQAQTDLNKAVVELQRVEGTILEANGVNLQTLGSKALH